MPDIIPLTCECCHDHICRPFLISVTNVCSWQCNGPARLLHLFLNAQEWCLEHNARCRIVSELCPQRVHAGLFPLARWFVRRRFASHRTIISSCLNKLLTAAMVCMHTPVSLTHTLYMFLIACRGATPQDHRILPRRIILVRHAESEGNIDNFAYTYVPDPQVPLVSNLLAIAKAMHTCTLKVPFNGSLDYTFCLCQAVRA